MDDRYARVFADHRNNKTDFLVTDEQLRNSPVEAGLSALRALKNDMDQYLSEKLDRLRELV